MSFNEQHFHSLFLPNMNISFSSAHKHRTFIDLQFGALLTLAVLNPEPELHLLTGRKLQQDQAHGWGQMGKEGGREEKEGQIEEKATPIYGHNKHPSPLALKARGQRSVGHRTPTGGERRGWGRRRGEEEREKDEERKEQRRRGEGGEGKEEKRRRRGGETGGTGLCGPGVLAPCLQHQDQMSEEPSRCRH